MADGSIVTAPSGWGYRPGVILGGDVAAALPELPLLARVDARQRVRTVGEAVASVPGLLERVRPRDLQAKYGLPQGTASALIAQLKAGGDAAAAVDDDAGTVASRILRLLAAGDATTGEIAAELNLRSKLAGSHLACMHKRGRIKREPYPGDPTRGIRRGWLWSLING